MYIPPCLTSAKYGRVVPIRLDIVKARLLGIAREKTVGATVDPSELLGPTSGVFWDSGYCCCCCCCCVDDENSNDFSAAKEEVKTKVFAKWE